MTSGKKGSCGKLGLEEGNCRDRRCYKKFGDENN